jgi:hypothetical protein
MKTPAGSECKYFYGDYFRGRDHEECRLLDDAATPPQQWTPDLCRTCPVPGITRANACENLDLTATVGRPLDALFRRRVLLKATCRKNGREVREPHIGCGECHPLPPIFNVKS